MAVEKRRLSPELIGRAIALAMVAAAIFVPPPGKFWLAAAGCALAAAVFRSRRRWGDRCAVRVG